MIFQYSILAFVVCFILVVMVLHYRSKKRTELHQIICNYESYLALLNYYMDRAYQMIYNDQVLVYSVEAIKLDDGLLSKAMRDFTSLVLSMIGPNLISLLTFFYGDLDTLIFNISEYFHTQYEADEIRKSSISKLMSSDEESLNEPSSRPIPSLST